MCFQFRITKLLSIFGLFQFSLLHSSVAEVKFTDGNCPAAKRMQVFCYIALWYPEAYLGRFTAADLDPFLCTHVVLAYFKFDLVNGTIIISPTMKNEASSFPDHIINTAGRKRSSQYLLSLEGYGNFNDNKYNNLARNTQGLLLFSEKVVQLLKKYQAHGADFVWNFLGRVDHADTGDKAQDLKALVKITETLCGRLKQEGFLCMITLAKAERKDLMTNEDYNNNIRKIIGIADFVNLWAFDFHVPGLPPPAQTFPLLPQDLLLPSEPSEENYYRNYTHKSINFLIEFYENACKNDTALLGKLSLMVPLQFGTHGFKRGDDISVNTETDMHSKGKNPFHGHEFQYQYPYFQLCKNLMEKDKNSMEETKDSWKLVEFPGGVPIAIGTIAGQEYTGAVPHVSQHYVQRKVAFAKSRHLGGITVFHITADDIYGWCFNRTYPILNAVNDELNDCRFL